MHEKDQPVDQAKSLARLNRNKPYCGVSSLLLPLLILAAWLLVESQPQFTKGFNGYAGLVISIILLVGTVVASGVAFVCSGVALFRRETYMFLPVAGAIANLLVCHWFLMGH